MSILRLEEEQGLMEKRKNWQLYLIIAVFVLTVYNILPTIFYYSNPLKSPMDQKRAEGVATSIVERVNQLEDNSVAWLESFTKNLGIKAKSIAVNKNDPQSITVIFENPQEAKVFKHFLPKAGTMIPFVPAQLSLQHDDSQKKDATEVVVSRQIAVQLDSNQINDLFHFSPKYDENHKIAPLFQEMVNDRTIEIAHAFAGTSTNAAKIAAIVDHPTNSRYDDLAISLAKEIVETEKSLGKSSPILKRWYGTFSQIDRKDAAGLVQNYVARLKMIQLNLEKTGQTLKADLNIEKEKGGFASTEKEEALALNTSHIQTIDGAVNLIEKNLASFQTVNPPLTREAIAAALTSSFSKIGNDGLQTLSLEGKNPFIESLVIHWDNDKLTLKFYDDVQKIRTTETATEASTYLKERLNQLIINDIAQVGSHADESIAPSGDTFAVNFTTLTNTQSILSFKLGTLAQKQSEQIKNQLQTKWVPKQNDLLKEAYPIRDYTAYQGEKADDQKLGLVIYAPAMYEAEPPEGFQKGSLYVIAKGLAAIENKYKQYPNSEENALFYDDIKRLQAVLQQNGFIGYPGASYGIDPAFSQDYIFELDDYYANLIGATRENFTIKGSKKNAILDMTDVEQRLLTRNKIDDSVQEDLLKWQEEYNQAQIDLDPTAKYLIPPPTTNPYWANIKLSAAKYFRGDERKILKWGLDLSGGKTVRIGLRDQNHRPVTDPDSLNTAVNELYSRINAMGVSERTIRIENNNIILDFPGSQGLSAAELIKASAMYFHIVNEKFTPTNPITGQKVNEFLQNVWNEAVVTNRKDNESINQIAWQHLGGDESTNEIHPRSTVAKELYESGLRLANPRDSSVSHEFNDTLSSVAILRGDEFAEWKGQSHPLILVFHNYALEGSSLTGVQVNYDPSEGNVLSFQVKSSYDHGEGSPRNDFYNWTSQFAEDQIKGTPKEAASKGYGWRMAVILNGRVISTPALRAALRDGGTISGHFTQREIYQLASDLKAGSLSFTPYILSEQNVSPELGKEERTKGIVASLIALALVVVTMTGYYRFAGFIASCAILFNLLIMWGVLQNLGAALTLPGIAGIVLTIGMAVDANVLVFERFREEYKLTGRLASAMQAGYRKAFNAIVDSNVTTIMAALILLQFDSGPVRGFAVTLIIGIVSSMFTALFMTRYFFAGWLQDPKHKTLTMSEFIGNTNFNFLAQTKKAFLASFLVLLVGGYLFVAQKNTMFGMDFTGGYSLTLEVEDQPGHTGSYRVEAADALIAAGASPTNVDVRELSRPTQLRIQMGVGLEQPHQPFYNMPEDESHASPTYAYQNNPRLAWLIGALEKAHLKIADSQLTQIDKNWTVMSGQFSDKMRNNALMGLGLALLSILAYITIRFEFKFAIAAVLGLAHDLLLTLGILAMFHKLGFAVQINLEIIGALMTIIGYSLNDTIIIFDRIREDMGVFRKKPFTEIVNHSINVTLGRTIMTSLTTLVVLLALVFLGGKSIFGFSLVMSIGVLIGTLSSLFIAPPILVFFHQQEAKEASKNEASPKKT